MTQGGYFILATTVALGMGIADGKLLFYHGISEESVDKTFSTKEKTSGSFMNASIKPLQMILVFWI